MKPKKGVMPPALKKYWAKRRAVTASGAKFNRTEYHYKKKLAKLTGARRERYKKRYEKRYRIRNPKTLFRLAIQKGSNASTRLYFDGVKFSKFSKPTSYGSLTLVKARAHALHKKYSDLDKWTIVAVPVRS